MKLRVDKLIFRGKVEYRDQAFPLLNSSGDAAIVERDKPRLLIIRCPCGCGDDLIVNLDRRVGPAWRYYRNQYGLSLYPSYWRNTACGSHFIIWNSQIYWCSGWETEESNRWCVSKRIEHDVLHVLPEGRFVDCEEIAEQLGLIPWEVYQACRQLVNSGLAISNKDLQRVAFCRLPNKEM